MIGRITMKHCIDSGVLLLLATLGFAAPVSVPSGSQGSERANSAWLSAAQHQAQADFWMHVAHCLADPTVNVGCGIKDAYVEMRDANARASAIFRARESASAILGDVDYAPQIVSTEFSTAITNPYFQHVTGRTLVWEKQTSAGLEHIESTLLGETKLVGGIACRVVREHEKLDGVLVEDTYNWVAQHQNGAVWYFGELALGYNDGTLDTLDGSWRFGKGGAKPGILMMAAPALGDVYRQEFLLGSAEDIAQVVRVDQTVQVPAGTFEHCVAIEEWDPLEPLEYLLKFFAPDIGMVLEIDALTGERSELVGIQD